MKRRYVFILAIIQITVAVQTAGQLRPVYERPVIYTEADTGLVDAA